MADGGEPRTLVSVPPIEASYEASLPAIMALREAVEQLQGLRAQEALERLLEGFEETAVRLKADKVTTSGTPSSVNDMVFPVTAGKHYRYKFVLSFRADPGNLDLGVAFKRPSGSFTQQVNVSEEA